ncbi:MAG: GNAT family N-acetyltransferase [Flavobacterium sp.]|nr:GNAT family N-acetyltransferase [Flavobacterium sp.]
MDSAALSHNEPRKSSAFFLWKFRDNPFGEAIIACAKENEQIVGCVAMGMQEFLYDGAIIKGAVSFETFVHPSHQGKGLFKKLITLAENECRNRGVRFLMNFPNSKSLPGFTKSGWTKIDVAEYWIKPQNIINVLANIKSLKKVFLSNDFVAGTETLKQIPTNGANIYPGFKSHLASEYLNWRFFTFPLAHYITVNNDQVFAVARIGKRGSLRELQVLFVEKKIQEFKLKALITDFSNKVTFDVISFPISFANPIRKKLKNNFFVKVPNRANVTYKLLEENLVLNFDKLELSAVNYHTY